MGHSRENATIAFDLGGTHLEHGLIRSHDQELEIVGDVGQVESQQPSSYDHIQRFTSLTNQHLEAAARAGLEVKAICLAIPNPTDFERGLVLIDHKPNLKTLYGVVLGELLKRRTGLPVFMLKDADASGLGVVTKERPVETPGQTPPATIIYLGLGTGPGVALLQNGKLVPGFEVYDQPYNNDTFEGHVSAAALSHAFSQAPDGQPGMSPKEIAQLAETNHRGAIATYHQFGQHIGRGLAQALSNQSIDPDTIILGGGISGSFAKFARTASSHYRQATGRDVPFRATEVTHPALYGAAAHALARLALRDNLTFGTSS